MLRAFVTCFTLSPKGLTVLGFCDAQAPVTLEFFFIPLLVFLTGGPIRTSSENFAAQPQSTVFLRPKHAQSLSSTHVAAIFTQPPPWRPTMKLSARGMHNKPGEYLFLYVGLMLSPFRHSSVPILRNVSRNYNNSVFKQNTCKDIRHVKLNKTKWDPSTSLNSRKENCIPMNLLYKIFKT